MKVIIAGSRGLTLTDDEIDDIVDRSGFDITEVVSGTARGIDRAGESWGREMFLPVKQFPAEWARYGKSAGYKRNAIMALYADALIAIWDGESRGTQHMIDLAEAQNLHVYKETYV